MYVKKKLLMITADDLIFSKGAKLSLKKKRVGMLPNKKQSFVNLYLKSEVYVPHNLLEDR